MSRAVYTVSKGGVEIARLEALIWVRLTAPGLYLVCGEDEGEGVLVGFTTFAGAPFCRGKRPSYSTT